ncbi:MAG: hypothetical protein AB7H66_04635 [Hyphomonadaceae bacterium]
MMSGGDFNWASLVYLLMALLLVTGAGWGFQRYRRDGRIVILAVVFWTALIVLIVVAYNAFN